MEHQTHWESVYRRKPADGVSWYRPHLERSLAIIEAAALPKDASIVDVGGGASTLVDDLLDRDYTNVTVVDLSAHALEVTRQRLGDRAGLVRWIVGDATRLSLPEGSVDFWHDRAVFHFLLDDAAKRRYVDNAHRAADADGIHAAFGDAFERLSSDEERHLTPWGSEQQFVYCYCRRA